MVGKLIRRARLFMRYELDLQNDRLIPQISAHLLPRLADEYRFATEGASRFTELGWKLRKPAEGKTYVAGLDFTFDDAAHAFILQDLEYIAILVRDLNAKLAHLADGRVEIQIGSIKIAPETPQECSILVEVFRDEIYYVESGKPMFVWDVGANIGSASLFFAGILGGNVAAFELFPVTAAAAQDNISRSGLSEKISLTTAGVGAKNEKLSLPYFAQTRGSNGMYGNDTAIPGAESVPTNVEIRDAREVIEEVVKQAGDRPILAKFDCEGAEYDIIERLHEAGKLRSLAAIVMELHAFPGLDPARVLNTLTADGFLIRRSRRPKDHLSVVYATRLGD